MSILPFNRKPLSILIAIFFSTKMLSQSLNLTKFQSIHGNSVFNTIPVGTANSKFHLTVNSYPKNFNPVIIKEFKFQNGLTDEEFNRLRKVKIIFGYINGYEHYIIDSNNDNIFLNEPIYDVKKLNNKILLKDVEFLLNNKISKKSITIKYVKSGLSFGNNYLKNIFVLIPYYNQTSFLLDNQTYFLNFINYDYDNIDVKKKIVISISTKSKISSSPKDEIVYYKIGDTALTDKFRIVFQDYNSNPLSINIKLIKVDNNSGYEINFKAHDLNFKDIMTNKTFYIQNSNKFILLDFWGTWCKPCLDLLPNLKSIFKRYGGDKFNIYGIAHDDELSIVKNHLKSKNVVWPNVFDNRNSAELVNLYKVQSFPTFILIDPNGKIIYRGIGKSSLNHIDKILSKLY
jgi:thiol-disulfide isomerase/thioredoxin